MLKGILKKILPDKLKESEVRKDELLVTEIDDSSLDDVTGIKEFKQKVEQRVTDKTESNSLPSDKSISREISKKLEKPVKDPIFYDIISRPVYIDMGLTFIMVEDNIGMNEKANEIKNIISRMLSNENLAFILIKYGREFKHNDLLTANSINKEEVLQNMMHFNNTSDEANLLVATNYILEYIEDLQNKSNKHEIDGKKVKFTSYNIITIGTGKCNIDTNAQKLVASNIATLCNEHSVNMKYFCINDSQTIQAAKLGFNLIGHINSNFYS